MVLAGRPDEVPVMVVVVVVVRLLPLVGCPAVAECLPVRRCRFVIGVGFGRRLYVALTVFVSESPQVLCGLGPPRLPTVAVCRIRRFFRPFLRWPLECDCCLVVLQWASMEGENEMVSPIRRTG